MERQPSGVTNSGTRLVDGNRPPPPHIHCCFFFHFGSVNTRLSHNIHNVFLGNSQKGHSRKWEGLYVRVGWRGMGLNFSTCPSEVGSWNVNDSDDQIHVTKQNCHGHLQRLSHLDREISYVHRDAVIS